MRLKDKKIQIYSIVSSTTYRLNPDGPFWAYYRQMSEKELYAAAAMTVKEDAVFIINYHEGIKIYDLVAFRGKYYRITRIDDFEGNRQDRKLYASVYTSKPTIVQ